MVVLLGKPSPINETFAHFSASSHYTVPYCFFGPHELRLRIRFDSVCAFREHGNSTVTVDTVANPSFVIVNAKLNVKKQ